MTTSPVTAAAPEGAAARVPPSEAPPAPTSAEAAQEEIAPIEEKVVKTIEFHGVTIELPDTLPGTVALDYAEMEDGKKSVAPIVNLIKSIIGQEQYDEKVYLTVKEQGLSVDDVIAGLRTLMDDCFAAYGNAEGESEASDGS